MWFDYFLTLPSEVRGIWQRRLSGVTLTYIGIRYTLLVDRIVILLKVMWVADDKVSVGCVLEARTEPLIPLFIYS